MSYGYPLATRLAGAARLLRAQAGADRAAAWYQLRIAASCPPDTRLHVRGGWVQQGSYWVAQETVYFPPLDLEFGSVDQWAAGYTGSFATAGQYEPVLVLYDHGYMIALSSGTAAPPMRAYGGEPQFETAVGAERELDSWLTGADVLYNEHLPLCGVILRNDGRTGANGAVLPIDPVNRGRSYFWRDLRPRHNVIYYDGYY